MLPERFVGAWERAELTIDGEPVDDAGRVVWVQSGSAFVDVRGPGGFASDTSFAGDTAWDPPHLTWAHAVDRDPKSDGVDCGHITFDGVDLIEEGGFIAGQARTYQERWQPLPGALGGIVLAAITAGGVAVRVGDHEAVAVDRRSAGGGFAARYSHWSGARWDLELCIEDGAGVELPEPLEPGVLLPDGWEAA